MTKAQDKARIGLIGLGVMGSNLALNIAEKGFRVAVSNRSKDKITEFVAAAGELAGNLVACDDAKALVRSLSRPRAIIIMIKAGKPVDDQIAALLPHLDKGDILIDAGNADFNDTRRRSAELAGKGIDFIGMGVSGGEEGARHGPSIMIGGPKKAYEEIRDIVEAIAARYNGLPCAARLGPDGAGHFVKTVHNGIEYADMQVIAEIYGLLRDGEDRPADKIGKLFEGWNKGPLQSYLVEITAAILQTRDPETGQFIVDLIVDRAGQKGTGRWTVIEALKLGQSASAIEAAVGARSWSSMKDAREAGEALFPPQKEFAPAVLEADMEKAMLAARIIAYGQGFGLMQTASVEFDWDLDLEVVAKIWRAGCIIRSTLLDEIAAAVHEGLPHDLLIFAPALRTRLHETRGALRRVVSSCILQDLPMPAMSAALAYFETMRRGRGTANLIQAQRDFFGAHGFERIDGGSDHHGPWAMSQG